MNEEIYKHIRSFHQTGLFILLIIFMISCSAPEPLSRVPKISLNDIYYKDITGGQDSLVLLLDFEDGNGDLGLDPTESYLPYHDYDFILNDSTYVTIGAQDGGPPHYVETPWYFYPPGVPSTGSIAFLSAEDNRPEYNCQNYEILYLHESRRLITSIEIGESAELSPPEWRLDTLYILRNEDRQNIFVDFFRKIGEDNYEFIDWTSAFDANGCGTDFNARFPIFDEDNFGSSLEGTMKYSMRSAGFNLLLRNDVFKLRIQIQDRARNRSNIIETEDLTLADLLLED